MNSLKWGFREIGNVRSTSRKHDTMMQYSKTTTHMHFYQKKSSSHYIYWLTLPTRFNFIVAILKKTTLQILHQYHQELTKKNLNSLLQTYTTTRTQHCHIISFVPIIQALPTKTIFKDLINTHTTYPTSKTPLP